MGRITHGDARTGPTHYHPPNGSAAKENPSAARGIREPATDLPCHYACGHWRAAVRVGSNRRRYLATRAQRARARIDRTARSVSDAEPPARPRVASLQGHHPVGGRVQILVNARGATDPSTEDLVAAGFYDRALRWGEREAAIRYVLDNPVEAGLVHHVECWPWVGCWVSE